MSKILPSGEEKSHTSGLHDVKNGLASRLHRLTGFNVAIYF